ncbi:MAG: FtsX-like permease family protein [Pseudomonadota bacterium]
MRILARCRVLVAMAWLNLFSHKGKNAIVGIIMLFGTFLVVLGTALLDSIERSMTKSITSSLAGHLQVYSKDAKDELALFGGGFMGSSDVGTIPDFHRVKETLLEVPNVRAVIPMGMDTAEFYVASDLDEAIDNLRRALAADDDQQAVTALSERIRSMAQLLKEEYQGRRRFSKNHEEIDKNLAEIDKVLAPQFWEEIRTSTDAAIEHLDTKIAPLVDENEGYFLRYLGTDLHRFAEHFSQFEMVSGEMVPEGARGILLSQHYFDDFLRHRVARDLDDIRKEIEEKHKRIATDNLLRSKVERMARQYRRVTFQLDPSEAQELSQELRTIMPDATGNIDELVRQLLTVNDANFSARYRFFFDSVAPLIRMHLCDVGDVITIRAYTKGGYVRSANIKVYGIFRFKGLETSELAGSHNLLDIMTYRDLYGMMTSEKRRELGEIQAKAGVADIERDAAETALFGAGDGDVEIEIEVEVKPEDKAAAAAQQLDELRTADLGAVAREAAAAATYTKEEIDHGMAQHAAIILDDPRQIEQSKKAVAAAATANDLNLKVVDWQQASGLIGQFVVLVRMVLYVVLFIIFLVALVIINNTMVVATMDRVMEIGTMRAIGAQSPFVLALFLLETIVLGVLAGCLGAGLAVGAIKYFGTVGIPANSDVLVFLFSGPRLFPAVGAGNVVAGLVIIMAVSLVATLYPAFVATRIPPVVAMQPKE